MLNLLAITYFNNVPQLCYLVTGGKTNSTRNPQRIHLETAPTLLGPVISISMRHFISVPWHVIKDYSFHGQGSL